MEPEKTMGPEKFLTAVLERMGTPDDDGIELRQLIVGWVGTAQLERGERKVERDDGWAAVAVNMLGDNAVKVWAERGGLALEMTLDALEARAYVLSANATATAMGFVRYVFDDVMRELGRQHALLCAGVDPQKPASIGDGGASEFDAGAEAHAETYRKGYNAALEEIRKGNEECPHTALPPADSVEPFGFRNCPVCGRRMRAYPASAGGPEWREAM